MKRGGELKRYTPIRAKAKLSTRVGIARRKAQSAKRVKDTGPKRSVVELVYARDGGCCIRCGRAVTFERRGEDFSVQHRRARGNGGDLRPETNLPANLVVLCGSATSAGGCHQYVESHRDEARRAGWSMRWKQDPIRVPLNTWWGPVVLDDKGGWTLLGQRDDGCTCDPVLCVNDFGHCEERGCDALGCWS